MEKMSKESIQAKLDVISELMEEIQEAMGGEVKGGLEEMLASKMPSEPMLGGGKDLKKVTVAAPDEEGLKKGLEMAKDMAPEMSKMGEGHGAEEMDESHAEHMAEMKNPKLEEEEEGDDLYSQMQRKKSMAKKMA